MLSRLRLGTQLWIFVSLLIAAASAGLAWYLGQVQTKSLTAATEQRLALKEASLSAQAAVMARNAALASASAAVTLDFDFLQGVMTNTVKGDDTIVYAYIADAKDKIVVHTDRAKVGTSLAGSGKVPDGSADGIGIVLLDEKVLEAAAPIKVGDEVWGAVRYGVSYEPVLHERAVAQEQLDGARARYRAFSWIITLPLILLAMIVSLLVASRLVRPLRSLEATMQQVLARNASLRVDVPKLKELARIATGFNVLLARLEDRQARLRTRRLQADLAKYASERALGDGDRQALATDWRDHLKQNAGSAPTGNVSGGGSLRMRLVGLILVLSAISICVVSVVLYKRLRSDLDAALTEVAASVRLDLVGKGLAVTRNAALAVSQAASVREYLFLLQVLKSTIKADSEVVTGFIKDPKGRVLVHDDPKKTGSVDQVAEHADAMRLGRTESRFVENGNSRILEFTAPIEVGNAAWGTLSFGLSHEHQDKVLADLQAAERARIDEAFLASAVGVGLLLIVTLLVAFIAAQRFVGPLNKLTRSLQKICDGDLSLRVNVHSCRELTTFSMSVNELTAMTLEQEQALAKNVDSPPPRTTQAG